MTDDNGVNRTTSAFRELHYRMHHPAVTPITSLIQTSPSSFKARATRLSLCRWRISRNTSLSIRVPFQATRYQGKNHIRYHGAHEWAIDRTIYGSLFVDTQMFTPSGRFQPDKKICFSMSDFHPGTVRLCIDFTFDPFNHCATVISQQWNPAWSVQTMCVSIVSCSLLRGIALI